MSRAAVLAVLILAAPAWAQPPHVTVTKTADGEEIVVEVNGVKAGFRSNHKTGEKWDLRHERNPWTLGATKRLHAHKVPPLPTERDPQLGGGAEPALTVASDAPADVVPTVIDINFFYTSACSAAKGGTANMPAFAALACAQATQTAKNSGSANVTFNCLGPFWVSYNEATDTASNPLNWMWDSANRGGEIAAKFTQTGADGAHMCTNNNACGQGYKCSTLSTGLSQSAVNCTTANLSFTHEVGHGLCLNHEPAQAGCPGGSGPGTSCPNDNYGYSWGPARDVETYYGGTRVTQFSNPAVLHSGLPTGVVGKNNNHRTFAIQAPVMAALRNRPTGTAPQAPGAPTPKVN